MLEQEKKISRQEVLKELEIDEDTLSLYERGLGINVGATSGGLESFCEEDLESIRVFHKLRESGLTYNEISLVSSFSEILKNVDFNEVGDIKKLLKLSPIFSLKQSLNFARQELETLRSKVKELETELEGALGGKKTTYNLDHELEAKQKTINNLDRKLQEALLQKAELETQLAMYKEGKELNFLPKGKKAKELYQTVIQKELEITEIKKKNEQLLAELEKTKDESFELMERLELMEDGALESEHEVEELYQEQITNLRGQIESLVGKKQKDWETYYTQASEQHKKEILTLQRKHEQGILRLKQKIKEQFEEIQELKTYKNPFLGLLKIGEKLR